MVWRRGSLVRFTAGTGRFCGVRFQVESLAGRPQGFMLACVVNLRSPSGGVGRSPQKLTTCFENNA